MTATTTGSRVSRLPTRGSENGTRRSAPIPPRALSCPGEGCGDIEALIVAPGQNDFMNKPSDWCDLDEAHLNIFGIHPDLEVEVLDLRRGSKALRDEVKVAAVQA